MERPRISTTLRGVVAKIEQGIAFNVAIANPALIKFRFVFSITGLPIVLKVVIKRGKECSIRSNTAIGGTGTAGNIGLIRDITDGQT